jgi:hypothetical protein
MNCRDPGPCYSDYDIHVWKEGKSPEPDLAPPPLIPPQYHQVGSRHGGSLGMGCFPHSERVAGLLQDLAVNRVSILHLVHCVESLCFNSRA